MCLFYLSFIAEFLFVQQMSPLCCEGFTTFSFSKWFQTMLIINYIHWFYDRCHGLRTEVTVQTSVNVELRFRDTTSAAHNYFWTSVCPIVR